MYKYQYTINTDKNYIQKTNYYNNEDTIVYAKK